MDDPEEKKNGPFGHSKQEGKGSEHKRRYTNHEMIVRLAEERYHKNGSGITFDDLITAGYAKKKKQAQRTLKYLKRIAKLITLENNRTNPQKYYPSSLRAMIVENRGEKIVPLDTRDQALD